MEFKVNIVDKPKEIEEDQIQGLKRKKLIKRYNKYKTV